MNRSLRHSCSMIAVGLDCQREAEHSTRQPVLKLRRWLAVPVLLLQPVQRLASRVMRRICMRFHERRSRISEVEAHLFRFGDEVRWMLESAVLVSLPARARLLVSPAPTDRVALTDSSSSVGSCVVGLRCCSALSLRLSPCVLSRVDVRPPECASSH